MVTGDSGDDTLLLKLLDSSTSEGTVDTKTVNEDGGSDELVSLNFLEELVVGVLVKDDGVVSLVLNATLRPLLLLSFSAGAGGRCLCLFLLNQ